MATTLNNLAGVYRAQEKWAEALPLFERAHAIVLQALGEEHPYTQSARESVAAVRARLEGEG